MVQMVLYRWIQGLCPKTVLLFWMTQTVCCKPAHRSGIGLLRKLIFMALHTVDYRKALYDYYQLTGFPPMVPRFCVR